MSLAEFLKEKDYTRIKLHRLKSNHFAMKATINGVKGWFILDTGASNTLVDHEHSKLFKMKVENTDVKVTGAGAVNMDSKVSRKNKLKIGKWSNNKAVIVLFNLAHVNSGLDYLDVKPVDGIIGTDILKKGKAIIDYDKKYLYLKLS